MTEVGPTVYNGRYELHRRLGRGGMAEVFLGRDHLLDRPVAVKVLSREFAADPSFVKRFRREAQSAANLNHPNIVGVYDWGEASGTYFIVMEYVDGRSLAEIVSSEGPLHPDRAADVATDVAAALGFAHRNGVVHRDVKPGNVLVTPAGQVKVADFGIARAITANSDDNLTQAGAVMGTATYFSPEQARGAAVDPRSDIYSLGCVLYEMVTGQPPFSGDSPVAIAYKHVQEPPTPPRRQRADVPPALEAIILKCLAKNPANRYPSAEDLRADLRRFREGRRILAEPVMAPLAEDPAATGVMVATGATAAYGSPATSVQATVQRGEAAGYEGGLDPDDRPGSKAFIVALVLLLVALVGLVFLLWRTLGAGEPEPAPPPRVEVLDVTGQHVEEARELLRARGLQVETEFEPNDLFEANLVFAQEPAGGTRVAEGARVLLRVSLGAETFPVPDVVGQQFGDAERHLLAEGFRVTRVDVPDEEAPVGQVVDQNPPGGADEPRGALITLSVSSGRAPRAVPDVTGMTVVEASSRLGAAGFTVAHVEEPSPTVDAGRVIRSDPAAGAERPAGSTVTLVVSSGVQRVRVPSVEGLSETDATSRLRQAGFQVEATRQDTADPNQDGVVIDQSPDGNSEAPAGSKVRIVVGRFVAPAPPLGEGP